jgi:hypothetical protein
MELLNYNEFYDAFMRLPAAPTSAWVNGRVVNRYPLAWWTQAFDTADYEKFTSNLPNIQDIRGAPSVTNSVLYGSPNPHNIPYKTGQRTMGRSYVYPRC